MYPKIKKMKYKSLLILTSMMFFLNSCSKDDNIIADTLLSTPVANASTDINDTGFKAK